MLLYMTIRIGGKSKKFIDVCYLFVIFIINITNFNVKRLLLKIYHENYGKYFLMIALFNGLITLFCIYILVGSRIVCILYNSDEYTMDDDKHLIPKNIIDFIPMSVKKKKLKFVMENDIFVTNDTNNNRNNISFSNSYENTFSEV